MKKTTTQLKDFHNKPNYYLKQIDFNATLHRQSRVKFDSPIKAKNSSVDTIYGYNDSYRKSGSLSQLSSGRPPKQSKKLDINLDKLKKMFPFANHGQRELTPNPIPEPLKLIKKNLSDSTTSFPTIAKSQVKVQKTQKNISSLKMNETRNIETPMINPSKNRRNTQSGENCPSAWFFSQAGMMGNKRKINQDHQVIRFGFPYKINIIGVCDGHGVNGHLVSSFISERLMNNMNQYLQTVKQPLNIKQIGEKVYENTNNQLIKTSGINVNLSGSTVVNVIGYNKKLFCFNVGDSRIILVSNFGGKWICKALCQDQKPCRKDQKQRIIKFGGRVQAQKDQNNRPIGPLRVWMAKQQLPGLAMTRAFGDIIGVKAGVIATPQIMQHDIKHGDCFLAAASDGVWQYMSNQQVMNILIPYYQKGNLKAGCQQVVRRSMILWKKYCLSRDDITVVATDIINFCPN